MPFCQARGGGDVSDTGCCPNYLSQRRPQTCRAVLSAIVLGTRDEGGRACEGGRTRDKSFEQTEREAAEVKIKKAQPSRAAKRWKDYSLG